LEFGNQFRVAEQLGYSAVLVAFGEVADVAVVVDLSG
jgi:hypothetical protein